MNPQSMQATAPSLSSEPQAGHFVGAAVFEPLPVPAGGTAGKDGIDPLAPRLAGIVDGVGADTVAGAAAGTMKGFLHVGHCTRLPAALSGTCIDLPQAALGHLMMTGMV